MYKLYLIPTPIGNLEDITYRTISTIQKINIIAVENIHHTNIILKKFNFNKQLIILNKHNEQQATNIIIKKLQTQDIGLMSNAGTPTINDPGNYLINSCYKYKVKIIPLPGACAAITALSASGIMSNKFCYEGFLPKKKTERIKQLKKLKNETRTIILYESKYRLLQSIQDIKNIMGINRYMVIARELTKLRESIHRGTVQQIIHKIKENTIKQKGEITIIIEGNEFKNSKSKITKEIKNHISLLATKKMSTKKISIFISKKYKIKKNTIYDFIINKIKSN